MHSLMFTIIEHSKDLQFLSNFHDNDNFAGSVVHPYALPLTLSPMEGPASPALTPINAQLDSEASSVSSDRDSAFPLDPEGSPLYFESGYSEEGRRVYSEREAEFLVAPVLDSEADSGTGSVCEEEADDAQDQVSKTTP